MEPLQFYKRLLERDGSRVESLVQRLRREDFDVYATGSSVSNPTYRDIDLVIVPVGLREGIEPLKLDYARAKLDRAVLSFLEHAVRTEYPGEPGTASVQAEYLFPPGETTSTYACSGVSERRQIQFRGTNIDITLTQTPFWTNPNAERVKL